MPHGIETEPIDRIKPMVRDLEVDAMSDDFRLYPISNCGKGQPMQTKKLGNGGPTMRSRAILTGGR